MTSLESVSDEEVIQLARHWRQQALRGDREARGQAHFYESEGRRRKVLPAAPAVAGPAAPLQPPLAPRAPPARPAGRWWRFW
jgi:hypothetical protein